ncbi:MAG TPA: hypothetical protein PK867_14480 [Pirellulales bacterium]|nr:hypothetical protein [Pirellulales bacterium]
MFQGWGRAIDPDGDCAIEHQAGTIGMTVVGRHDLSIELPQPMNAPRVMQDIEGDFIAIVEVDGVGPATGPSTVPTRPPYLGAGFLLWQDEKNYVRLEHASVDVDGQVFDYLAFEERKNGAHKTVYSQFGLKRDAVRLRLERRSGKLYGAASYDAQQWFGYPPLDIGMPAKVQLGVAAISSSSLPFTPEFKGLEVYRRVPAAAPRETEK